MITSGWSKLSNRLASAFAVSIIAFAIAIGSSSPAQAGPITHWDLQGVVDYTGSPTDLVVTFQLVQASNGRVLFQLDNDDLTRVDLGSTIQYSYSMNVEDAYVDSGLRWVMVVDATNASGSVKISQWKQICDDGTPVTYSATCSGAEISGHVGTERFIGEAADEIL